MKKLMIAAAIVCAAVISQAATYNWNYSTGALYAGYNASKVGGTSSIKETGVLTYLMYYGNGADAGITQAKLLEGLRGGKTMANYSSYVLATANTGASDAKVPVTAFTTNEGKVYDNSGTDYLSTYVVIVDGDNVYLSATANSSYNSLENTGDVKPTVSTSMYRRDLDGKTAFASGGWYSTVPEPTSGLLLLLGMAGLALRRKQK